MAFSPVSGKLASVTSGETVFAFDKFDFEFKAGLPKVNNFTSPQQQLVSGITEATVTVSGPYDVGNMTFTAGDLLTISPAVNGDISWDIPAYVESIKMEDSIEDAARVTITLKSSGTFTAAIT